MGCASPSPPPSLFIGARPTNAPIPTRVDGRCSPPWSPAPLEARSANRDRNAPVAHNGPRTGPGAHLPLHLPSHASWVHLLTSGGRTARAEAAWEGRAVWEPLGCRLDVDTAVASRIASAGSATLKAAWPVARPVVPAQAPPSPVASGGGMVEPAWARVGQRWAHGRAVGWVVELKPDSDRAHKERAKRKNSQNQHHSEHARLNSARSQGTSRGSQGKQTLKRGQCERLRGVGQAGTPFSEGVGGCVSRNGRYSFEVLRPLITADEHAVGPPWG